MMIEVQELCKDFSIQKRSGSLLKDFFSPSYYKKEAVKNISFKVKKGEIVGYIGKNGAGKSTTIKMLSGILHPSSGRVEIDGIIPYQNRIQNSKNIGVVFGQRTQLWWDIPIGDTLNLMKEMYQVSDDMYNSTYSMLNSILNLDELSDYAVRQLSLGQRMRADIACAMIHNPKVLFLDEPTIGLDILMKRQIREFIKEINNVNQTTILLTTHDMHDIERLCNRIIVIDKGEIFFDGTKQDLYNKYDKYKILKLTTVNVFEVKEFLITRYNQKTIADIQNDGDFCRILFNSEFLSPHKLVTDIQKKFKFESMTIEKNNIEDIISIMLSC